MLDAQYVAWYLHFKVDIGVTAAAVPTTTSALPPGLKIVLFALPFAEFIHQQSVE